MRQQITMTRRKPPCKLSGVDCPMRRPGCQGQCEEFQKYRKLIDEDNSAKAAQKKIEDSYNDYMVGQMSRSIVKSKIRNK